MSISDNDPDLADAGSHHRLDAVEEHRLVGHRNELFSRRIGKGSQSASRPAGEYEGLQKLKLR